MIELWKMFFLGVLFNLLAIGYVVLVFGYIPEKLDQLTDKLAAYVKRVRSYPFSK